MRFFHQRIINQTDRVKHIVRTLAQLEGFTEFDRFFFLILY